MTTKSPPHPARLVQVTRNDVHVIETDSGVELLWSPHQPITYASSGLSWGVVHTTLDAAMAQIEFAYTPLAERSAS